MLSPVLMTLVMMVTMNDVKPVSSSQPSVYTGDATVFGISEQVGNVTVNQYLGLRYAQPPVGDLRFRKPVAAPPLTGLVNATSYPISCPGVLSIQVMEEDCLFLSLYVPQSSGQGGGEAGSGLAVMVWLHGGGFVFGSGSPYDGSLLAAEGNVIVAIPNYRLGLLGFLSTGDNSSVGNYGLWDQWLALTWVRDNIGHFGGDVNRVTLFGESAGAASVSYQMTSPHSQGLFHRAILHSGSRLCPWAMDREALKNAQTLAMISSCGSEAASSTSAMVSCLRGKPWEGLRQFPKGAPVVDGDFVLHLNQSPVFDGPFIMGVNNREGGMLLQARRRVSTDLNDRANYLDLLQEHIGSIYPAQIQTASHLAMTEAAEILACVYRRQGSTKTYVTDEELEAVEGDVQIVLGSQQFLDEERVTGEKYFYYFDHYPDNIKDGDKGMDHALDIYYTFGFMRGLLAASYSPWANRTVSPRDRLLGQRFRALLSSFARSGNPNPAAAIPDWPEWPPYVKGDQDYFSLTSSPRVASHLHGELRKVWMETVPGVLLGRGAVGLKDTRWARCERETGDSPALSVSMILVLGTSLWGAGFWFG